MTQGNDSAAQSGDTPDATPAPAKKTRSTTKKTAPRATAAKAGQTETPSPATGEPKAPSTRAATKKTAASGTRKAATARKTESNAAPAQAAGRADAPAAKTAKPASRPRRAAKPKSGETAVAATETGQAPAAEAAKPAKPAGKTGRTGRGKTAGTAKAAPARDLTESVPEEQASDARTAKTTPSHEQAASPAVEQASPDRAVATAPGESLPRQAESQAESHTEARAETQAEDARKGQEKTSSSRRSRRGGRRRNKAKSAAMAAEAVDQAPVPTAAAGMDAAEPYDGAPDDAQDEDTPVSAGTGAKKAAAPAPSPKAGSRAAGKRKMFISVLSGELVEVVLAEDGNVVEYYVEMQHQAKVKGNIYKGVVSNIDANLQAAFVSYAGGVKNGFLQIDEVHPEYYLAHHEPAKGRKFPPIQKVLKPGQEMLVQVVKEPAGTKGAFLTSYLSLPGRFVVLTPGREQIGVSRKVDGDEERNRLRALLEGLKVGKGLGVIVRTASTGASKTSLQRDLQFLKRLWKDVRSKGQTATAPGLIYEELDLSTRAVRDYLTDDVQEVWVDDAATAEQVKELASLLFPKKQNLVQVHALDNGQTLFERFSLQKQLDQIHSREVGLPSGGSLVIDKTEALTAIDINSGRSSGKSNFEDMAFRTNMEAAKAIPLQLRLRDIGGQVVADFIEMRDRDHWRDVEKTVRAGMKGDRARYDVGKIGPFGMLEIVRQRLGSSAISISTEPCPCCKGTGIRRNMEWQAMQALREINKHLRQAAANSQASLVYHTEPELAFYLLNAKRAMLQHLEHDAGVTLTIAPKTE